MKNFFLIRFRILKCSFKKITLKLIYSHQFFYKKQFFFRKRFNLLIEKNGKVEIGKRVFFNNDCSVNCVEKISIGDYTIFGENVKIYDHNHVFNKQDHPISSQGLTHKPVHIGKNCWIGSNVTILKGADIGDNCVIGAGCVINERIPDKTIVRNRIDLIKEPILYK